MREATVRLPFTGQAVSSVSRDPHPARFTPPSTRGQDARSSEVAVLALPWKKARLKFPGDPPS